MPDEQQLKTPLTAQDPRAGEPAQTQRVHAGPLIASPRRLLTPGGGAPHAGPQTQ
jgi:hypothetical protein